MKKLLNPKWILLINTLPIVLLLFLEWSEFEIIKSLLQEESIYLWKIFTITIIVMAICNAGYAVVQMIRRKRIDIVYCIISLIAYISFIYTYYGNANDIIPFSIPDWMISGNLFMYVGICLMPTLIHAIFASVIILTPHANKQKAWQNIAVAVSIPFLFYILVMVVLPIWDGIDLGIENLFLIFTAIATVLFIFFLIRFIYILISRRNIFEEYQLLWKLPIAIIFPILGLIINNTADNLFGDFSSEWFYIIAIINGILICIPATDNKMFRLFLFSGRCITFMFTLYFFLIMMPFLPISIFAIIIFGAGFLMLTPLFLFPIHLNTIVKDFNFLKRRYNKYLLYTIIIVGISILPIAITIDYRYDRNVLHTTLEYLYSPDYTKEYKLNKNSISKTLDIIENQGNRRGTTLYNSTPFLSSYYKWLVLDNLNISETKKALIRDLFYGKEANNPRKRTFAISDTTDIKITDIKHSSKYDSSQKAWISKIDLSIKNGNTSLWNSEYITKIDLPTGCWISDYYLYVEGIKEKGILAEKKAATWVFNQIRNTNRDPGLLRYLAGNRVEFKVFPFQKGETRYTGIEFIHKEPVSINIDGHILDLGDKTLQANNNSSVDKGEVAYISAEEKEKLETIGRKPYYHFIIDTSSDYDPLTSSKYYKNENGDKNRFKAEKYIKEINNLLDRNLIEQNNAKISLTNTYVKTFPLENNWEEDIKETVFDGGFFLDRAIKKILFDSYTNPSESYPVIIVVSDNPENAILYNDFANMRFTYPENDLFYSLKNDSLKSHTFSRGLHIINDYITALPNKNVKVWPRLSNPLQYLPDDNKPSIVLNTKNKTLPLDKNQIEEKNWEAGLLMQAQWMLQTLYPETADKEWLALLQNSFKSQIMSPLTSYIVVENEAQKAILKKKQEQVMGGNRSLDLDDTTQQMTEPNLFIILALLGILYILYKKRKNDTVKK
ncbi:MSEP-CTERM sorting domain-containing protein [Dysgonomonas sp. Marseille-P4677]|uniref:MSEP-CTERM sorting domain-containing protein n=1 Tax=Dysgonomonas sp. Marseille-P4677 TaxID=2364790 RepID=UPI001913A794|nr:MSEP-CTERM sorting domain-containing protein [Dysgonomonas sp. Marseille-P4677]MBK5723040.1 MSEP-CTERM sorting domain-containing protein [Dysgonomonas sp. Marseille-P4677]